MTGKALICKIKNISAIEGADRIVKAEMYGETVIVSKDNKEGDLGILFSIECQLSHEFCHHNNLYRNKDLNSNPEKSGYIEENRRVRPISLKGVKCSGFWIPVKSLDFTFTNSIIASYPKEGTQFTKINGVEICKKYVPPTKTQSTSGSKKNKVNFKHNIPTFKEHFQTNHFFKEPNPVKKGDLVIITEKLHGTSFRCGLHQVYPKKKWYHKLFGLSVKPEYKFVVGSRKVIKSIEGESKESSIHFYDEDIWSKVSNNHFKGKLKKGETIYGEIVGYIGDKLIMPSSRNEKLKPFMDKEEYQQFIQMYGDTTEWTYNCSKGENKIFIYRITRTNEDGEEIDLTWEQLKKRANELDVPHVEELTKLYIAKELDIEDLIYYVRTLTSDPSYIFSDHIKEGVCVRIENEELIPKTYKNKAYNFRILEGHIKKPSIEDEN